MAHVHGAAGAATTGGTIHHAAHAAPAAVSFHNMARGAAATGAVATASNVAGRSFMSSIVRHPVVLLGIGVAIGYTVHKYRKEIIESANRAAEKSKDFVLQQRENLEDLVAETQDKEA
jgi:hypothetical protein